MEILALVGGFILLLWGLVALRGHRRRTLRKRIAAANPGGHREIPVLFSMLGGVSLGSEAPAVGTLFVGPADAILAWRRVDVLCLTHWTESRLRWDSMTLGAGAPAAVTLRYHDGRWQVRVKDSRTELQFAPDVSGREGASGGLTLEARAELLRVLGKERCLLATGELGSAARWWRRVTVAAAGFVLLFFPVFIGGFSAFGQGPVVLRATLGVVALAVATWLFLSRRTAGRVEFGAHTIEFIRENPSTVFWREIVGYRDDSADYIQLVHAGVLGGRPNLAVPTPTEAERVSVLALLDGRGLHRMER